MTSFLLDTHLEPLLKILHRILQHVFRHSRDSWRMEMYVAPDLIKNLQLAYSYRGQTKVQTHSFPRGT
jgi:hypothetical protein